MNSQNKLKKMLKNSDFKKDTSNQIKNVTQEKKFKRNTNRSQS